MRLFLDGPFDLGAVFGVGDEALAPHSERILAAARELFGPDAALLSAEEASAAPDADDGATTPYAVEQPFGRGLRIRVSGGPLLAAWRADAQRFLAHTHGDVAGRFGPDAAARAEAALERLELQDVTLFLFGIGAGSVRLRTGGFSAAAPEDAICLFHLLEFAGYGDAAPAPAEGRTANAMIAAFRERLRKIAGATRVARLTDRAPAADAADIRGFQGLVLIEKDDPFSGEEQGFYATREEAKRMAYGSMQLGFTWLYLVARETDAFEVNTQRLLSIYLAARTAWDVSHRMERAFADLLQRRLAATLKGEGRSPLTRADLNVMKSLAEFVVSATTLRTLTAFAGDAAFFAEYERYARIEDRQMALTRAQAAFASAEEEAIFQIEATRSRRLSALLAVLTIVSLVGVPAGVLSAWDQGVDLLGGAMPLAVALAAPAILAFLALLALRGGQGR